jgi:hypothetical protein
MSSGIVGGALDSIFYSLESVEGEREREMQRGGEKVYDMILIYICISSCNLYPASDDTGKSPGARHFDRSSSAGT